MAPFNETPVPASDVAAPVSKNLCLMPVLDGKPTAADVNDASRMASDVEMIPGVSRPWIRPYNRGGEWTIDEAGRYVRFDGPTPLQLFSLEYVVEDDGRVVGLDQDGHILVIEPGGTTFLPLLDMGKAPAPRRTPEIARLPRADITLIGKGVEVWRLKGDFIQPWSESGAMHGAGLVGLADIYDLPDFQAALFVGDQGTMAVRFDNGRWAALPRLAPSARGLASQEYVVEATAAVASGAVLIRTDRRFIAMRLSEGRVTTQDIGVDQRARWSNADQLFVAAGPREILRFRQRDPADAPQWSRLGPTGFVDFAAGFAPRRGGKFVFGHPIDVTDRGWMVFASQDGLVIYDGRRMTRVASSSPVEIGSHAQILDLSAVGRLLVVGDRGVFELDRDRTIHRLNVPFRTGFGVALEIGESANTRQIIAMTETGVFALAGRDGVTRVRGGDARGGKILEEIPVSHDLLVLNGNALALIVDARSPRWRACLSAAGARRLSAHAS